MIQQLIFPAIIGLLQNPSVQKALLDRITGAGAGTPPAQVTQNFQEDVVAIRLGPAMRERVKAYQSANGLSVDGVPGEKTLASMLGKLKL